MTKNLKRQKAFTLIELLIVIGILAILAITLLLALNPAEAQKKNRDLARIKHVSTLQTIIDQYLNDGQVLGACFTPGPGCNTISADNIADPCGAGANWLQMNVCNYAQTVPVDPRNGQDTTWVTGLAGTIVDDGQYWAQVNGSNYEIDVRLEAETNRSKINNDNGDSPNWLEVGTGPIPLSTMSLL